MTTLDPKARDAATLAIMPWLNWKPSAPETIASTAITAYLDALSSLPAQAVGVKALEWRELSFLVHIAESPVGNYNISQVSAEGSFFLRLSSNPTFQQQFSTLTEAKAAAQADYEARILSALVAPSHPAAVVVSEAALRSTP